MAYINCTFLRIVLYISVNKHINFNILLRKLFGFFLPYYELGPHPFQSCSVTKGKISSI